MSGANLLLGLWKRYRYFSIPMAIGLASAIGIGAARYIPLFSGTGSGAANETREALETIRAAAYRWQIYHGDAICPSIRQLVEGKFLDPRARKVDLWEQPIVIACLESGVVVTSFGPDRKRATPDDIVVSSPANVSGGAK
jgi:hypothetical protein